MVEGTRRDGGCSFCAVITDEKNEKFSEMKRKI